LKSSDPVLNSMKTMSISYFCIWPACLYIRPGGRQLRLTQNQGRSEVEISGSPVNELVDSTASACARAVCMVLRADPSADPCAPEDPVQAGSNYQAINSVADSPVALATAQRRGQSSKGPHLREAHWPCVWYCHFAKRYPWRWYWRRATMTGIARLTDHQGACMFAKLATAFW
jgi:hypothetical protein